LTPLTNQDLEKLITFEKELDSKVERKIKEALEPVCELEERARNIENRFERHVTVDATENVAGKVGEIEAKIKDPDRGILAVQKELCMTLQNFREESKKDSIENRATQNRLKKSIKHLNAKQEKQYRELKTGIYQLRGYGIAGFFIIGAMIITTNTDLGIALLKILAALF
jgi:hypothetical protein